LLVNKYNLKYCCFAGEDLEDKMMTGITCVEVDRDKSKLTFQDISGSTLNAARLYQAAREKMMQTFNNVVKNK
jgi:uncharacterized protein YjbI with pentapeptide repeats